MKTVKITPAIANEYATRCVWEHNEMAGFPNKVGQHEVDDETARQMLDDARHYVHRDGPDLISPPLKRAYASLAAQLI